MMLIQLSMEMRFEPALAIEPCGGTTRSVFPQVEAWLMESADRQDAIRFIGRRKDMMKYRSMMDFLFCELFVQYRNACFRFYEDAGPGLIEMVTVPQWRYFNKALLAGTELAFEKHSRNCRISWKSFRKQTLQLAAR